MLTNAPSVLHVLDELTVSSGVAQVVMSVVTGVTTVKQDVAVYGAVDPKLKDLITTCGGSVHVLPGIKKLFGATYANACRRLFNERSYDIIHGHLRNSAFIYLRIAKDLGIRHRIIHAHSSKSSNSLLKSIRNDFLSMGLSSWANCFIAPCIETAEKSFGAKTAQKTHIIHNAVDTNRFSFNPDIRAETRKELNIPDNAVCVGHVGRFAKEKNHAFIIDIFRELRKTENCVLVLAGDGDLTENIKKRAESYGLSRYTMFLGARADTERLYQAFDAFVLPSFFEGYSIAAVEAQCAGLGCVLSDCVPKAVICGHNTRSLPLGDPKQWACAILEVSKQLRADGAGLIRSAGLDLESMYEKFAAIYENPAEIQRAYRLNPSVSKQ